MPPFGPISRRELIRCLRRAGFEGPFAGGNHQYMRRPDGLRLTIPNPHAGDISRNFLRRLLRQAQISREEWEKL
ncbi:MAG: type II toxin-antitoxin system HicA family toxin [Caldilineae bacterium]|nr:MAG: type II toxin-antitoxin system HicA family toxin [Caldilineae bacterium]